jgi:hypothetical protein
VKSVARPQDCSNPNAKFVWIDIHHIGRRVGDKRAERKPYSPPDWRGYVCVHSHRKVYTEKNHL